VYIKSGLTFTDLIITSENIVRKEQKNNKENKKKPAFTSKQKSIRKNYLNKIIGWRNLKVS